jgi:hypothetical protein
MITFAICFVTRPVGRGLRVLRVVMVNTSGILNIIEGLAVSEVLEKCTEFACGMLEWWDLGDFTGL